MKGKDRLLRLVGRLVVIRTSIVHTLQLACAGRVTPVRHPTCLLWTATVRAEPQSASPELKSQPRMAREGILTVQSHLQPVFPIRVYRRQYNRSLKCPLLSHTGSRNRLECLLEIGNDILNVLNPHRHLRKVHERHRSPHHQYSTSGLTRIKSEVTPDAICSSAVNC